MQAERRVDKTQSVNRQPSLAIGPEKRRMERKLQDAGVFCQPEVSIQYQMIAKRSVLRGVESGGSNRDIGRYVTFCDEHGEPVPWLQPIDSVATNGRHSVVITTALISVDVFRMRNTYELLIARHRVTEGSSGRGRIESKVIFRGRQGYLPLDLTKAEKDTAGQILPEFFNKAGERMEIPPALAPVVKGAVRGANCIGCTHQHYVTAPKLEEIKISPTVPEPSGSDLIGVDA